jgi:hypothetical protein
MKAKSTRLTRKTLSGVWCALILPWTDRDRLDARRFAREIRGYGGTGVSGVYTGGTTGEFYAQDDATFEQVTEIACAEAHALRLPIQIGASALSTRTTRMRIRTAIRAGADALPEGLKIGQPSAGEGADDHPGVLVDLLDPGQDVDRGLPEMDDFGAGLGVRQPQGPAGEIHVFPMERHDLAEAATGQDQQSRRRDSR